MDKAERLRFYNETHRPMCFGREHDMKPFCRTLCKHYEECGKAFWDKIQSDGKAEPLPERNPDE
jgi:hypothetical protein